MKLFKCLISGLLSIFLVSSCSTTSTPVDLSVYEFDDLPTVSSISNWTLEGWRAIDNRSLIVQTSPRDYYLFILSTPNPDLRFSLGILVTSTLDRVQAGFDTVSTPDDPGFRSPINRIYRLTGSDQAAEVTQKIQAGASTSTSS